MTILYTIFTQSLRHCYDLPRPMRHTLQRHDGGLWGVRAHQARVRQENPRRRRQHRAQEGSVSQAEIARTLYTPVMPEVVRMPSSEEGNPCRCSYAICDT
jgi:hypothetical protein